METGNNFNDRVRTRLSWLGIRHLDLAYIIGMDPSCLSRVLRALRPRKKTLQRIALGLGMTPEDLLGRAGDPLCAPHPGLSADVSREERVEVLATWYATRISSAEVLG